MRVHPLPVLGGCALANAAAVNRIRGFQLCSRMRLLFENVLVPRVRHVHDVSVLNTLVFYEVTFGVQHVVVVAL